MTMLRRAMLGGGINIGLLPNTQKLFYVASSKIEPKKDSLGSRVLANSYDATTGEGVILAAKDITEIGDSAFEGDTNLLSIILPSSVTSIGRAAFRGCVNLKSIPDTTEIINIKDNAFALCTGLETPIKLQGKAKNLISASVFYDCSEDLIIDCDIQQGRADFSYGYKGENISITKNAKSIADEIMFSTNNYLKNVYIEDGGITIINDMMFYNCGNLTTVSIPQSITTIRRSAFSNCTNLIECNVSSNLQILGDYAFSGCKKLPVINGLVSAGVVAVSFGEYKESYDFSSHKFICSGVSNNSTITNVFIPDTIIDIESGAFTICGNIALFEGKFSGENGKILYKDNKLIAYANRYVESFTIPEYINTLGRYSLRGDKFDELVINELSFEEGACVGIECNTLRLNNSSVSEDKTNTWSSNGAFANASCKKIIIPRQTIGSWWFNSRNVEYFEILAEGGALSKMTIKERAFYNCTKLKTILFQSNISDITSKQIPILKENIYTFWGLPEDFQIVVPDALYDKWVVADKWSSYADHIIKASEYEASLTE